MKKSIVKENAKRTAAVMAAIAMSLGVSGIIMSQTTVYAALPEEEIVSPLNIAITKTENDLAVGFLGKMSCYGKTNVESGYKAAIKVELQH